MYNTTKNERIMKDNRKKDENKAQQQTTMTTQGSRVELISWRKPKKTKKGRNAHA